MLNRNERWFFIRINTIFIGVFITLACLGVRLYFLQVSHRGFYREKALRQQVVKVGIDARRGTIYDVNGMTFAASEKSTTVCLLPDKLDKTIDSIRLVSRTLNVSLDSIRRKVASGKQCVYVLRKISDHRAEYIKSLNLPGLHYETEIRRNYPNVTLGCHIVGITGVDGEGLEGIELRYNRQLEGIPGYQRINRNALTSSGSFIKMRENYVPPIHGSDIYLTVDGYIQGVTEQVLDSIQKRYSPDSITAVVVDPRNGRILAMANRPDYSPSHFGRFEAEDRKNRAIVDVYEPGSVMKVFTASAAIETGIDSENKYFDCENGVFHHQHRILHDHHPYEELNLRDIIVHSSNIGVAKVGLELGKNILYSYFSKFGFGRRTGIAFPGEQPGYLRPLSGWDSYTITSIPMGHEITATSLQIVMGMSAIANGGILYKPQLIDRIIDGHGRVTEEFEPAPVRRVISEKTSARMRNILQDVVEVGTGKKARIHGTAVGGKTGTAQMLLTNPITGKKEYSDTAYVASFCGFAPAEAPRLCVIISVFNPKGSVYYGGSVAAPGVREIFERTLEYVSEPVMKVMEVSQR